MSFRSAASAATPLRALSRRTLQTTAPLPPAAEPSTLPTPIKSTMASRRATGKRSKTPARVIPATGTISFGGVEVPVVKNPQPVLPAHLPPLLPSTASTPLPTTVSSAISLLKTNSTPSTGIYVLARLHARTYLLHPRDILTLPRLKPLQSPGTKLALTRILEVGCREYAIRSPAADGKELRKSMDWDARSLPTIPSDIVTCDLTVLEHTTSPVETRMKKKRRKGYQKTIKLKNGWTRLRVGDIILKSSSAKTAGMTVEKPSTTTQ